MIGTNTVHDGHFCAPQENTVRENCLIIGRPSKRAHQDQAGGVSGVLRAPLNAVTARARSASAARLSP